MNTNSVAGTSQGGVAGNAPAAGASRLEGVLIGTLLMLGLAIGGVLFSRGQSEGPRALTPFDVASAYAAEGFVSQTGGLTVLTTEAGTEDLLLILDGRAEELFIYSTDPRRGVQLMQRYGVPQLFVDARALSVGTP